jgi:hypothetical protein
LYALSKQQNYVAMEDLALLSLLETVEPSSSSFLSGILEDACGVFGSTWTPNAFTVRGASIDSLARIARTILVDALSRGAVEPSFSDRLVRAGVSASAASLLSAALFGAGSAAAVARGALSHSAAGGLSRLVDFDWSAKATLASSSIQGARGEALLLKLRTSLGGAAGVQDRDAFQDTTVELSRDELSAVIYELGAMHDTMIAVAGAAIK